jgi:nucleoside 2-deoxyribosyltransferase
MRDAGRLQGYLAAPLFNNRERAFNLLIEGKLRPYINVFLPQRDGKLLKDIIAAGEGPERARSIVFNRDIRAIEESHLLVAILDGRTVDEGVAFELGYARALGKFCIGLKTDDRSMLPSGDNPMIISGCHEICADPDDLLSIVRAYSSNLSFPKVGGRVETTLD